MSLLALNKVDTTTIAAPAADKTLTAAQTGTVFICSKAAGGDIVIHLPSPTIPGLYFKFIMIGSAANVAHALTFTSPTAATVAGQWRALNGAATASNATDGLSVDIAFTANALGGDVIEMVSDGALWNAYGSTHHATGIAFG